KAGLEPEDMKRKTKEGEEPKEEEREEEEEQEEEKQPESCEEEEKAQEEEPTEEDEEEEKSYEVLDEAQIRQIVADEIGKALAPITEALKSLNEIKTLVTKAAATRSKGPRGIVVAREIKESQKNAESTAKADFIIP
ncbi:hypothetical protein, partial [Candidatus Darwinibacter acetoxidans]